jgi:hypothetical protein
MFVELMANIKNEVLHNLFRPRRTCRHSKFLATLPQFCCASMLGRANGDAPARGRQLRPVGAMAAVVGDGDGAGGMTLDLPFGDQCQSRPEQPSLRQWQKYKTAAACGVKTGQPFIY